MVGRPYVPHFRFAWGRRAIFASRARSTSNVCASIWGRGTLLCSACSVAIRPLNTLQLPSVGSPPTALHCSLCNETTKRWMRPPRTTATAMPTHPARPRAMQSQLPAAIPSRARRVNERRGPIEPVFTADSESRAVICKSWTIYQYHHHSTVYSRLGEPCRPR